MVQDSARHGAIGLPGIAFAIASCSAYITMKGVMMPNVSAGSNQIGARETCEPMVIWPSGAALAGFVPAAKAPSAARHNISRRVTRAVSLLELGSSWSRRDGRMLSLRVAGGLQASGVDDVVSACQNHFRMVTGGIRDGIHRFDACTLQVRWPHPLQPLPRPLRAPLDRSHRRMLSR